MWHRRHFTVIFMQCPHCTRTYTRAHYFNRHVLCCKILSMTKHERKLAVEEEGNMPSGHELYIIVQELASRQDRMDQRLKRLEAACPPKRKQCILTWLSSHPHPSTRLDPWFSTLQLPTGTVQSIIDSDYPTGTAKAIITMVKAAHADTSILPLACLAQKEGVLYGYGDTGWKELGPKDFGQLLTLWSQKIMVAFKTWQDDLGDTVYTEKGSRAYHAGVQKVMGGMGGGDSVAARIRNKVYTGLRVDLKSVGLLS